MKIILVIVTLLVILSAGFMLLRDPATVPGNSASEGSLNEVNALQEETEQTVIDAMRQAGRSEAEIQAFIERQEMPTTPAASDEALIQRNIERMRSTGATEEQIQDYIEAAEREQQGEYGI